MKEIKAVQMLSHPTECKVSSKEVLRKTDSISTPKLSQLMGRKLTGKKKKPLLHANYDHGGIFFPHQDQQYPHPHSPASIYSQVDCFLHHGDALETPLTPTDRFSDY